MNEKMLIFKKSEDEKLKKISEYLYNLKSGVEDQSFDDDLMMDSLFVAFEVHPITVSQFKSLRQNPQIKYLKEVVIPELMAVMKAHNVDPDSYKEFTEMKKKYLTSNN